jgi:hypothetical protein
MNALCIPDHPSQIDIAHVAPLDAALHVQLLYRSLFYQSNSGFEGGDVDQDIFAQGDGWGHSVLVSILGAAYKPNSKRTLSPGKLGGGDGAKTCAIVSLLRGSGSFSKRGARQASLHG